MNRHHALIFWGSLFYVEYRWGLTLNRFFVVSFVLTASVAAYYFIALTGSALMRFKSSRLLSHPIAFYRRKLFIYVMIASVAFYGFYYSLDVKAGDEVKIQIEHLTYEDDN